MKGCGRVRSTGNWCEAPKVSETGMSGMLCAKMEPHKWQHAEERISALPTLWSLKRGCWHAPEDEASAGKET